MFLLQHFINNFLKRLVFISFSFQLLSGIKYKAIKNFNLIPLQNCAGFCTLMGGSGGGDISGNQSQRLSRGRLPSVG